MSLILSAAVNIGSALTLAYNIHKSGFVLIIIKMITKNAKQDIENIMIALNT